MTYNFGAIIPSDDEQHELRFRSFGIIWLSQSVEFAIGIPQRSGLPQFQTSAAAYCYCNACLPRAYPSECVGWLLSIKLLKTFALPTGPREFRDFNNLSDSLGEFSPIELQGNSAAVPKPFGAERIGSTTALPKDPTAAGRQRRHRERKRAAGSEPTPEPSEFRWTDNESVVLAQQPATAVYFNPAGGLVIRQERAWNEEEDTIIVVAPQNVQTFLDAVCDVIGVPGRALVRFEAIASPPIGPIAGNMTGRGNPLKGISRSD